MMNKYAQLMAEERQRQITKEGWTPEHDDEHVNGELADAAASYSATCKWVYKSCSRNGFIALYPFSNAFLKKEKHDRKRQLIIAGALLIAELERLERLDKKNDLFNL